MPVQKEIHSIPIIKSLMPGRKIRNILNNQKIAKTKEEKERKRR